jgi:hypothetical protein
LYGLDVSRRMADCVERAIAALEVRGGAGADLRDSHLPAIARWVTSRSN